MSSMSPMPSVPSAATELFSDAELPPLTDDELTALALAADPDLAVDDDAVNLWDLTGTPPRRALPEWYMPAAMGGTVPHPGWRRRAALVIIAAFLTINAYGLCNTYGELISR